MSYYYIHCYYNLYGSINCSYARFSKGDNFTEDVLKNQKATLA